MQLHGNWFIVPSKNTVPTPDSIANAVWQKDISQYQSGQAGYELHEVYENQTTEGGSSSGSAFEQFRARAILEFHKERKLYGKVWLERNGELWALTGNYASGSLKFYDKSSSAIAVIPLSNPINNRFFHVEDVSAFFSLIDEPVYFVEINIGDVTSATALRNEDIDYFSEQLERVHGQGGTLII